MNAVNCYGLIRKLSEVERRQNKQKLGCVPFLCCKNIWRQPGQVPSHWQTGWGPWPDCSPWIRRCCPMHLPWKTQQSIKVVNKIKQNTSNSNRTFESKNLIAHLWKKNIRQNIRIQLTAPTNKTTSHSHDCIVDLRRRKQRDHRERSSSSRRRPTGLCDHRTTAPARRQRSLAVAVAASRRWPLVRPWWCLFYILSCIQIGASVYSLRGAVRFWQGLGLAVLGFVRVWG